MKQTAVEWLVDVLSNYDSKMIELFNKEIEQAKEMEKQQIIESYDEAENKVIGNGEKYYNKTFK
jgi:hypothetical protein